MHLLHLLHAHPWIGGLIGGPVSGVAAVLLCRNHKRALMWVISAVISGLAIFQGMLALIGGASAGILSHREAAALSAVGAVLGFGWLRWDSRDERRHDARERDRLLGIPAEYRRAR
jgi:putative Ca2+/H+ antiporter (TMEM165/GDT1 family)